MAPFECTASSLLCQEDNNIIMGFDDDDGVVHGTENENVDNGYFQKEWFLQDLIGFPLPSDEYLGLMVEKEREHLPREDYLGRLQSGVLDASVRREAVNWIMKVHAYYCFGPLSAYLSINYLDRFISNYDLPQGKSWMTQLLSVACLSLAAKMDETEVPLSLDLQCYQVEESKFVFEARTIQKMELLVLSTLNWRMQSITPFSFIGSFLQRITGGNPPPRASISQSVELILSTIRGIEFLEFKPSEIAAAVAISVSGETEACINHVEKVRVLKCCEKIQELGLISRHVKVNSGSVASVPQSPVGVLDVACLSCKSDEITVGSCANSHTLPPPKRRKLNRLSDLDLKS